ncbi:polypeptide deformylase [Acanthamoeba castellanii str. Neff]|jgi:peptide deformylase|uniref:Peptide deformylase n=1 Tax=Acanthamoeba castellanii (strain ATCC 30010 / Neff) TaxID=1257118 RepID=L8HDV2_ACACF|nr:polypeptide deformylase [Acanthamoeba castellanii str. Neff]ELR23370.1 polypeptide deformylase [Acanthamoeba castellanii str. Neff]
MNCLKVVYPQVPALVHYPHPVLRLVAQPVTVFDDDLRRFCQGMFACMASSRGVGLAAPQVGVSKRIFVTDRLTRSKDQVPVDRQVWINPRLENTGGSSVYKEGCLSFPGIFADVTRYNGLDIVAQDEWGVERRVAGLDVGLGDFLGVVVQHELDHLNGRVFVDHLTPQQFELVRARLGEMEADYKQATGEEGTVIRR